MHTVINLIIIYLAIYKGRGFVTPHNTIVTTDCINQIKTRQSQVKFILPMHSCKDIMLIIII